MYRKWFVSMFIVLYGRDQYHSFRLFDIWKSWAWLDPWFLALLGGRIWGLLAKTGRWILPMLRWITGHSRVVSLCFAHEFLGCKEYESVTQMLVDSECPKLSSFPGDFMSSNLGQHQSPRQPDYLCCSHLFSLSPPATPNMSFPVLGLSSTWENMWQSFGKFSETRSNRSQGLFCCCQVSRVLPMVSVDHARPAWQRPQGCGKSAH